MAPKKEQRLTIPPLGEWYSDLLNVDAAINGRSPTQQLQSLGCAKLQEREDRIRKRVEYLALKRGLTFDEMWKALVVGTYKKIAPEEWAEMPPSSDGD